MKTPSLKERVTDIAALSTSLSMVTRLFLRPLLTLSSDLSTCLSITFSPLKGLHFLLGKLAQKSLKLHSIHFLNFFNVITHNVQNLNIPSSSFKLGTIGVYDTITTIRAPLCAYLNFSQGLYLLISVIHPIKIKSLVTKIIFLPILLSTKKFLINYQHFQLLDLKCEVSICFPCFALIGPSEVQLTSLKCAELIIEYSYLLKSSKGLKIYLDLSKMV